MLKVPSFLAIALLGTLALPASQEPGGLQDRVAKLEEWKTTAETRIQALEKVLKAEGKPSSLSPVEAAERVLTVEVTNKRFDPSRTGSDPSRWKLEDNIWWDATYTAVTLERPARSIKGVLKFCDLFGDPQFQVRVTLDDAIEPKGKLKVDGVGIKYNQFDASHKWLRSTELEDMTVRFEVQSILYKDGTTERFGS